MQKKILLTTCLTVGVLSALPALAQNYSGYQGQPGAGPSNYQPYYTAQNGAPTTPTYTPQADVQPHPMAVQSYASTQYASTNDPFAPISERIITDPLYLPLHGQVYGASAFTFGIPQSSNYNGVSKKISTSTNYTSTVTQTLSYGISDEFSAHFLMPFQINSNNVTSETSGTTVGGSSYGFGDPTLGVTYRAIDQARNAPVDVDFTVNYTPDMIDDKAGGGGHVGTVGAGRQSAAFIAGIGHEMKMFTVAGTATATYQGDRTYESLLNDNDYKQDSGWTYGLALNTETRFTDRLSLNLGTGYVFENNLATSDISTGAHTTAIGADTLNFNAALNYHFIPNRLVGSATYSYDWFGNSATDYPAGASNTETKHHDENIVGLRLDYMLYQVQ